MRQLLCPQYRVPLAFGGTPCATLPATHNVGAFVVGCQAGKSP